MPAWILVAINGGQKRTMVSVDEQGAVRHGRAGTALAGPRGLVRTRRQHGTITNTTVTYFSTVATGLPLDRHQHERSRRCSCPHSGSQVDHSGALASRSSAVVCRAGVASTINRHIPASIPHHRPR
jgi:hypothetical protein